MKSPEQSSENIQNGTKDKKSSMVLGTVKNIAAGLAFSIASLAPHEGKAQVFKVDFETKKPLPDSLKDMIMVRVLAYNQETFGALGSHVTIRDTTAPSETFAFGKKGTIYINRAKDTSQGYTLEMFGRIMTHELSHTFMPEEQTPEKEEFEIAPGQVVYAYQGLSIFVKDKGKKRGYPVMNEAMAEVVATLVYHDGKYMNLSPQYARVFRLMYQMVTEKWFNGSDLISATKTSNPRFLVGKILNKDVKDVKPADFFLVYNSFNKCFLGSEWETLFEKIKQQRMPDEKK